MYRSYSTRLANSYCTQQRIESLASWQSNRTTSALRAPAAMTWVACSSRIHALHSCASDAVENVALTVYWNGIGCGGDRTEQDCLVTRGRTEAEDGSGGRKRRTEAEDGSERPAKGPPGAQTCSPAARTLAGSATRAGPSFDGPRGLRDCPIQVSHCDPLQCSARVLAPHLTCSSLA